MKKRKHTGWIFLLVLAILITHMPTAKMGEDNDTELIDLNGVPFETILSGNAKKDNKEKATGLYGYYRLYDDGLAIYYSKNDYVYDTKENAIWLPEREDYPLKNLMEDADKENQRIFLLAIVGDTKNENGYATTATYIDIKNREKDTAYKKADLTKIKKEINYEKDTINIEPMNISFYRLMGDPWKFDGKKIRMECVQRYDDYISINQDLLENFSTIGPAHSSFFFDEKKVWENIIERYTPYGATESAYVFLPISNEKLHIWLTGVFYLYKPVRDSTKVYGYGMSYKYEMSDLEIQEKDLEKYRKAIIQLKKDEEKWQEEYDKKHGK